MDREMEEATIETEGLFASHVVRTAFRQAAAFFVETVARVPADAWDRPGLGDWSMRALVGHTSRSLLTVETYLDAGATEIALTSPAAYYVRALALGSDSAAITERGRQAGAALGDDPLGAVQAIYERVMTRLDAARDDARVGTVVGGMTLITYLPTRIVELTIHTLDLIAALGEDVERPLPDAAAAVTAQVIIDLAHHRGRDGLLLLAATGRRPLPVGFTVL
jgi:Mycothiol maleylpyruvate isomerase N-terminal domain